MNAAAQRVSPISRQIRAHDKLVLVGPDSYQSLVAPRPGVVLAYFEGALSTVSVIPMSSFIEEQALSHGAVMLLCDATRATSSEKGRREAWLGIFQHTPRIVRSSYSLITRSMLTMSANLVRMATGGIVHAYASHEEWAVAVHAVDPLIDTNGFETKLGR
jgi:hypothetical protein